MVITEYKNLKQLNSFGIATVARYYAEIENEEDFKECLRFIREKSVKYFVLGGGSNVVFLEDFYDGIVLKVKKQKLSFDKVNQNVTVSAGMVLDSFIEKLCQSQVYSFSYLSLIPGTIGGAIYGNAGAYGLEISEMVMAVKAFDMEKGAFITLNREKCVFSYRNSVFKANKNRFVISEVTFSYQSQLKLTNKTYRRFDEFVKENDGTNGSESEVRDVVIKIRSKKFPNPLIFKTAGSIFKNAIISYEAFEKLRKTYQDIPHWKVDDDKIKISTGYLLDVVLRIRGKSFGKINVSEANALIFYTAEEITGEELFSLVGTIKESIFEKTNIRIEEEVLFVK